MATIKQTLQNVANTIGVAPPDSFVGNSDQTARRLLRSASAAGRYLRNRNWRSLTFEHTFSTATGTLSYALPTSPAFHHLKPLTSYDRTTNRAMMGTLDSAQWQYGAAILTTSGQIDRYFRIQRSTDNPRVDKLYLLDDPAGTYTLAFEYVTHEWLYNGSNGYIEDIAGDANVPQFDDYVFEAECLWRALRALGEAYDDEKDEAMRAADLLYAQENQRVINMGRRWLPWLAANTPEGNWS